MVSRSGRGLDALDPAAIAVFDHARDQRVLVIEVPVDRALGQPRSFADGGDGRAVEPARTGEFGGGFKDPAPRFLSVGSDSPCGRHAVDGSASICNCTDRSNWTERSMYRPRVDEGSLQLIQNLAYVTFRSTAFDAWRSFGADIVGAALAMDGPDGSVRLRLDGRPWRLAVAPGDRDELESIGWDVRAEDFDATIQAVERFGCVVQRSTTQAKARSARELATFVDPFGLRHELVVGVEEADDFVPAAHISGLFVTGEQGMGHIVLMLPNLDAGTRFVTEALGMELSDTIEAGQTIQFFHCVGTSARHHSLAITEVPGRSGVHHVMVEFTDADDVGCALDRVRAAGLPLSMDYGRHPNDLVTSFYVRTPSGFDLEVGAGGLTIDDAEWQIDSYDTTSLWGHHPPQEGPLRPGILNRIETSGT